MCGTNIKAISCILSETLGARGLWSNEALSLTSEPSWYNTWPPGEGGGGGGGSSRLGESDMMRVVKRNHSASNWFTCTFSCFRSTWHLSSKMSPCLWLSSLNIVVWYTLSPWKYFCNYFLRMLRVQNWSSCLTLWGAHSQLLSVSDNCPNLSVLRLATFWNNPQLKGKKYLGSSRLGLKDHLVSRKERKLITNYSGRPSTVFYCTLMAR